MKDNNKVIILPNMITAILHTIKNTLTPSAEEKVKFMSDVNFFLISHN